MLIDTNVTIAYKCYSCGSFEFFNTSLFKFLNEKENALTCRCNNSSIVIVCDNARHFNIRIPCIGCGREHTFVISIKDILSKCVNVVYCPETGMQQCFIGNDEDVRKKIDNLEKELDEIINHFGYDSYFSNTQVMFDALNKIHDIAEMGNLFCECGSKEIELLMFSDNIQLKCSKCTGSKIIKASSNNDLKDLFLRQQIILSKSPLNINISDIKPL